MREEEAIFLGMEPKPVNAATDPDTVNAAVRASRKIHQQQNALELQRVQAEEEEKFLILCLLTFCFKPYCTNPSYVFG